MEAQDLGFYIGFALKIAWDIIIVAAAIKYLRSK